MYADGSKQGCEEEMQMEEMQMFLILPVPSDKQLLSP